MLKPEPLTIEVLGGGNRTYPVVLDRVIGGTTYLDEAKRTGRHLLARVGGELLPWGFRVLSPQQQVVYEWHVGDDETTRR
jgi:hypothetical protein